MANYKKSFNFRHGVQVDNDNFIVNANGLVGIGTSIPKEFLDVKGNAAVSGIITTKDSLYADQNLYVGGITTCGFTSIRDDFYVVGVITANTYFGNGRRLDGVVSISTDGFIKTPVGLHTGDSIGIGSTPSGIDKLFVYSGGPTSVSIGGTSVGSIGGASLNLQNRSVEAGDYTHINGINGVGNSIAAIRFYSENKIDVSDIKDQGYLTLLTTPFDGEVLERVRIASDGKVGIGTTIPGAILDVDGDVSFRGSTGVSSISWDKTNNRLEFLDNVKATFGTSDDLEIYHYHDGSNTIKCTQSGQDLYLSAEQGEVYVQTDYGSKNAIACYDSAGVKIYYDNNPKFETLSIGATVTGDLKVSDNLLIAGVTTSTGGFKGNLTGTATTSTVAIALTDSPHITVSNVVGVAATFTSLNVTNDSFTVLETRKVGIGTTIPTSELQIRSTYDSLLEVITDRDYGNARIAIGESVGLGNSSASLRFSSRSFEINNHDTGPISLKLHTGNGVAVGDTGGFDIYHNANNIFKVSYDGNVGINRSGLAFESTLDVGGDVFISNNATVVGVLTIGTGVDRFVFGDGSSIQMPDSQNFNTISGISTFNQFIIGDGLIVKSSTGMGVTIQTNDFFTSRETSVGIGTTGKDDWNELEYNCKVFGDILVGNGYGSEEQGKLLTRTHLGVLRSDTSTDGSFLGDPRNLSAEASGSKLYPPFDYGNVQIESRSSAIMSGKILLVPSVGVATVGFGSTNAGVIPAFTTDWDTRVGINTYIPRGILDISRSELGAHRTIDGSDNNNTLAYVVFPQVDQTQLDDIATSWETGSISIAPRIIPEGIPQGSLLFNTDTSRLEVGIGATTFCGIATLTNQHILSNDASSPNNGKLLSAFIPPVMTGADRLRLTNAGVTRGSIIYNIDDACIQFYNGSTWKSLTGS